MTGTVSLMSSAAPGTFAIGGDLTVNRIGFGAMRLARNGMGDTVTRDPETARAVLRRAAELGVDHIDTADFYRSPDGTVRANDLIREALFPYPAGLVIATKVGPVFGPDGPTQGTAADLRPAVEANLEALGIDRLDLVYLRIGGPLGSGRGSERDESYVAVAQRHGATVAQVALAHALALSPNVLAIPGTGSLAHLEENMAARSLALTPDDMAALG
jgi:aryl-alcohol dehydrogenase-like predicted oxidoreductase